MRTHPWTITTLNEAGFGVGQTGGRFVAVARTAPGDVVVTGPLASRERWTHAALVQVVKPGPDRVTPPCPAFERGCGGCQWQHLSYPAQAAWKEKTLAGVLRGRGGFTGKLNALVLSATEGYRNKLSLKNENGRAVFVPEFEGTLSPAECRVQTAALQKAWAFLRTQRLPRGVDQIHLRSNELGQVGVHVFANRHGTAGFEILRLIPGFVGAGVTLPTKTGPAVHPIGGGTYQVWGGDAYLRQSVTVAAENGPSPAGALGSGPRQLSYLVPHNGFYQTNETQASALLDVVRREVGQKGRLLDLYCGSGFFALALADLFDEVVGIEVNAHSVEAARQSALLSGVKKAQFLVGDLGAVLAQLAPAKDEVAVIDPPREGLLPQALAALTERAPRRLVYVSCYPVSLARDLKRLAAAGWKARSCTPVDMFPHTSHVEAVLTLER
ncbi:MAG: class I SAM-dependent RNA methyltransferase [Spirochaetales bacterium]|nr:class I SAM-dependent RNA methyltransferase [Spirochaetales bacterium]